MAALLGFAAHILVPAGTASSRIEAIAGEGATVTVVDGSYDDAVALSATLAGPHAMVISDTSWPGYEAIPRWTIEGYATIFWEIEDELARRGEPSPDIVVVQIGVGALAAAVVRHYRRPGAAVQPRTVGVEPLRAACLLASIEAGQRISIPGPYDSIMAGLNAGTPSLVAWPIVQQGIDVFVAIEEEWARQAVRALAAAGVVAGETGGAGIAGLMDLLSGPEAGHARATLGIDRSTRVLALSTEGATDPASYHDIVGGTPLR
jgi:diaminopropionate ammonia-lyase